MRRDRARREHGTGTSKKSPLFPSFFKRSTTRRTAREKAGLGFEQLEPRLALAVVISEFLADNAGGITDFAGEHQDWIELHNTGGTAVDVAGWHLTDDAANLTKWEIPSDPSTLLAPGEYLTIFASSKNGVYSGELHTNFKLATEGEYLGLVMSDGTTVASDFGTAYPAQFTDVSYGVGATASSTVTDTLVGNSSPLTVISPTSENAARDDHWREIDYDDSGWLTGTGSVGFDRNSDGVNLLPYINRLLLPGDPGSGGEMDSTDATPQYSAYVRYEFDVTDKAQLTSLQLDARFDDGLIVYLNDREVARANFAEDYAFTQPMWKSWSGHQQGTSGTAGAYNRATESLDLVTWDLTPYLYLLADQNNVLAFHLVNYKGGTTAALQDLFVDPELTAERATGIGQVGYIATPTPGNNDGLSTLGFVADTQFSRDRGFYDTAFNLEITTATPGATIRYTTDGSVPTLTNGASYTGPISIDPTDITNGERGVFMIRAAAFKDGYTPSNVDTQTYIFLDKVILQDGSGLPAYDTWGTDGPDAGTETGFNLDADEYDWEMDPDIVGGVNTTEEVIDALKAIPTVSIVMNWDDLWSGDAKPGTPPQDWNDNNKTAFETEGIYIHSRSDERASSMEYFSADGTEEFQVDAAIEIQGHSSAGRWSSDKLSFQVKFREPYGDPELNYPLFTGTADGENATTRFDTLILDAQFNYTWIHQNVSVQTNYARYVQDQVTSDLQNLASGGGAPHGKFVHLYLDGVYWGLYDLHERPDEHFAADYYGGDDDDYYVVKHANNDTDAKNYTWVNVGVSAEEAYAALLAATENARANTLATYQAVANILDIDEFIDYSIALMYAANGNDWPHNNWYATYDFVENGQWRFHSWDQEHAFPTTDNDAYESTDWNQSTDMTVYESKDANGPGDILHDLVLNDEFRLRFSDRVQELMRNGGVLTESVAQSVYEARLNEVYDAIIAESARWGDNREGISGYSGPYTQQDWIDVNIDNTTGDHKAVVPDFFPVRTSAVLGQFDSATNDWLVTLAAPNFNQYGGEVPYGFDLVLTNPGGSGTIYYTTDGSDPRLAGGGISGSATAYTGAIDLTESTQIRARVYNSSISGTKNDWSAEVDKTFLMSERFPLRIVELHYNPNNGEEHEFIELLNTGSTTISLDGVQIGDFAGTPYSFQSGQTLDAGERIVVARNPVDFTAYYGSGINLATGPGYANANLSNGGEMISVLGPVGELVQRFNYGDSNIDGWPDSPDGVGPSLEYIGPLDEDSAEPSNPLVYDPYDDPANWQASAAIGGSPGTDGSAVPIPGDYDGSGTVDDLDFDQWKSDFGMTVDPAGTGSDGNGNGVVDAADYTVWRDNYGATAPGSGSVVASVEVVAPVLAPVEEETSPTSSASATAVDDVMAEAGDGQWSTLYWQLPLASRNSPATLRRSGDRLRMTDRSELLQRELLRKVDRLRDNMRVNVDAAFGTVSSWLRRHGSADAAEDVLATAGLQDTDSDGESKVDVWGDTAWLKRLSLRRLG